MEQSIASESSYRLRVRTNARQLFYWNVAWVTATALMAFGPKFLWNKSLAFTLLAIGLEVGIGVGMILANKKYIVELDDLQQKVHLNALAITVGLAVIVGVPLSVMNTYKLIPFRVDISDLIILMGLTYLVCCLYGTRRYR